MSAPQEQAPLRLAGVVRESIVDGPGLRLTVFVQGCPHHCPGCHNPQTHDPRGGYDAKTAPLLEALDANPLLRGITLSGGEPIEQAARLLELARAVVQRGRDVVLFTGYTFEQLLELGKVRPAVLELTALCCLLVDGPFVLEQRDLSLRFRGSTNQRLLDPAASLAAGQAVASTL
ncbi:MAG: anaerobic ribonucleoside-triphosphate reductase activating protein [Oscillospiraceae bacterium]